VGLFDFLTNPSGNKARGWDHLPAALEAKASSWTVNDIGAVMTVRTLVHGPGAYDQADGDATNSAVYACLQVIATAVAEPPLRVYRVKAGDRAQLDDTPLGNLLDRPNPHMTLSALLAYLSNCLHINGNAYWRKLRAGNPETGNVVELWPISPSRIEPRTTPDSGEFVSFYRYYHRPGQHEDIAPSNIVHFRQGLDDRDHRLGLAPLKRLLREISSDDQATRYADRLLSNLAINGLSMEFDKEAPPIDQATADEIKARITSAYSGDNVGAVSVLSPGAKLVSHGFSPEQMDMKTLHRVPEERIAAVLGVPAIVAGLGAGLDRSTYSNFAEAREAFTEMKLVPFWRSIADTLTMALVPDFMSERGTSVAFMIDDVRALQDDQNAKATRLQVYVSSGILTVDEARAEIGHEPLVVVAAPPALALPEQRSRPRMLRSTKALDDLPGQYDALRDDLSSDWETALRSFLAAQLARVTSGLRAGGSDADGLVADGEATLLGEVLRPLQGSLLSDVRGLVVAELGVTFDLDDAATRAYLQAAGENISGITSTTRDAVRAALAEGQALNEGIPQLAARLQESSAFGPSRAVTIARTELGFAANNAALANYRASGLVVGLRVFDGDYDSQCAAMNGRTFPIDQPPAMLQHPRCRRALAPIIDAAELDRSA